MGLSCRLKGDVREHPIAKLYCLNCDPDQPKVRLCVFVRELFMRGSTSETLPTIIQLPATIKERTRTQPFLSAKTGQRQLLVRYMFTRLATLTSLAGDLTQFDECGFLKSSPCLGDVGALDDRGISPCSPSFGPDGLQIAIPAATICSSRAPCLMLQHPLCSGSRS